MSQYEEGLNGTPGFLILSAAAVFPAAVTLTGTVTSAGLVVTGTGTKFLSEICIAPSDGKSLNYKYIYDASQNEVREIHYVISDTELVLKVAFSVGLGGIALTCPDYRYAYREVCIACSTAGPEIGCVNQTSAAMMAASTANFRWMGGLKPIAVDPNGEDLQITTLI